MRSENQEPNSEESLETIRLSQQLRDSGILNEAYSYVIKGGSIEDLPESLKPQAAVLNRLREYLLSNREEFIIAAQVVEDDDFEKIIMKISASTGTGETTDPYSRAYLTILTSRLNTTFIKNPLVINGLDNVSEGVRIQVLGFIKKIKHQDRVFLIGVEQPSSGRDSSGGLLRGFFRRRS